MFKRDLPAQIPPQYGQVVAELGIGNGTYLRQVAKANPQVFFLGVDMFFKPLGQTAKRLHRSWARNVRLIRYNALHPAILFPDGFLDGVIVNFPDPWPKDRHSKHRIFEGPIAHHLKQVLKPHGWVFLQTDQEPYFQGAWRLLEAFGFEIHRDVYPPILEAQTRSYFHRLFESQRLPIYRFLSRVRYT
jgi:tRNA (guanine-N7-)-methyltransferase